MPSVYKISGGDWQIGTGFSASVFYKVKGAVRIDQDSGHKPLCKCSLPLVVNEKNAKQKPPSSVQSTRQFHKGEFSIIASLDNSSYYPGNRHGKNKMIYF